MARDIYDASVNPGKNPKKTLHVSFEDMPSDMLPLENDRLPYLSLPESRQHPGEPLLHPLLKSPHILLVMEQQDLHNTPNASSKYTDDVLSLFKNPESAVSCPHSLIATI